MFWHIFVTSYEFCNDIVQFAVDTIKYIYNIKKDSYSCWNSQFSNVTVISVWVLNCNNRKSQYDVQNKLGNRSQMYLKYL